MIRIVIIGQNRELAKELFQLSKYLLQRMKVNCELILMADGQKVLEQLKEDAYFYDVFILYATEENMKIADKLRSRNLNASLIWMEERGLTAEQDQDTGRLFRYRPSAYLPYPVSRKKLAEALFFSIQEQQRFYPYFTVKNKDRLVRIKYKEILWFDSNQRVVTLHTLKQEISFYAKLTDVHCLLPEGMFIRCHQSYIVNLDKVMSLDKRRRCFVLQDGREIEISKSCYQEVLEYFQTYIDR